jgi:hypothetical protein
MDKNKPDTTNTIERVTLFSPCRAYRYTLWREWDPIFNGGERYVCFIGLNPSTADEVKNDPTIRRCIGFAMRWGYSALCMVNLFAFRATDPGEMMSAADPVGPENDAWLVKCADSAGLVVAAWGVNGNYEGRASQVSKMISGMQCLGFTSNGSPRHPLYVRADTMLENYS